MFIICNESMRLSTATSFSHVALHTKSLPTPDLNHSKTYDVILYLSTSRLSIINDYIIYIYIYIYICYFH